jgi:hypothetical protein
MTVAFVLGNGISRQDIDLNCLKPHGRVYGCNAIYREFEPDVLISTDTPISNRIQHEGYSQTHVHYTRNPLPDTGARRIVEKYFGFSSGPTAVAQAAIDGNQQIYLLGFDMGPTRIGRFNNIYADSEFYKKSSAVPTYTGNWVRQLATIMKDYPRVEFFRVVGETTAEMRELLGVANLTHLPMINFQTFLDNSVKI